MSLNPYLYFDGHCEEAFRFYEKCLGGRITFMMTWEDSPMPVQAPAGWAKKILHVGLAAGAGVLEGCDAMPGQYKKPESFCVMLRPTNAAEADRIFTALAEGGAVQIPIAETFWALRFGKVVDRFGVPWLVNCENPSVLTERRTPTGQ
jgi:PhnB protein